MPTLAVSPVHIKEVNNLPQLSTWKGNFSLWLRWSPGVVVQVLGLNPERSRASHSGPRVYLGPRERTEILASFRIEAKQRGNLIQVFEVQLQRWWDQTLLGSGRWHRKGAKAMDCSVGSSCWTSGKPFFLASARLKQAVGGGGKEGNLYPWKFLRLS